MEQKGNERQLNELVRQTESLLKSVEQVDEVAKSKQRGHSLRSGELEPLSAEFSHTLDSDAYMTVTISADRMIAHADFYPVVGSGTALTMDRVQEVLKAHHVAVGVDWDAIEAALRTGSEKRVPLTDIVVARGVPQVPSIPPHIELLREELLSPIAPGDRANASGKIDFRSVSPFVMVSQGEVVARRVPRTEGTPGITVVATKIEPPTEARAQIRAGENLSDVGGELVASRSGRLTLINGTLNVSEVLEISGDVDYSTGNIDFPGDVCVFGEVKEAFSVKADRDIFCKRTLEASEVLCGGDLTVKMGIVSRGNGMVVSSGNVVARFIENCSLRAGGDVFLESGIVNARIKTHGKIETAPGGAIIGGSICAQNGVSCGKLGAAMGTRTEIYCGIDHEIDERLAWIRDRTIELAMKHREITSARKRAEAARQSGHAESLRAYEEKIRGAIHKMNQSATNLVSDLDRNDHAEVHVLGTAYPGVYIEICKVSFVVSKQLARVRFHLDKATGRILVDAI